MTNATIRNFVVYFLRLGALGFGGPVALANHMRRDLVEERGWITEEEYENGLALAAACPGPLAYQLGVYCGYIRFGVLGGLAVAVAFALPPFLLVVGAAALYVRFTGNWQLRALFYGIAPAVVALIVKACWNLGKRTLRRDYAAWTFAGTGFLITAIVEKELALMFVAAGIIGVFVFGRSRATPAPAPAPRPAANAFALLAPAASAFSGTSAKLFLFFFKTGLLVFGSGLVIVPFLKAQVVDQYHWLGNREFLDSVAIGMISPGPVVITATFVGYLLDGVAGALAATAGIFSPPVLFTVIATPILLRYHKHPRVAGFIRGVGVTVVGVLAGTTYLVGKEAIGDWLTVAVAVVTLAVITKFKKLPEPCVIIACGLIGLLTYPAIPPHDARAAFAGKHHAKAMDANAKAAVLFMCPYGGAKSVIAASYFNRIAEAERLPYVASAAAAETPYAAVPKPVAEFLGRDGIDVSSFKPRHVTAADLDAAAKVVSIDCDLSKVDTRGAAVEQWSDVPKVSDDLPRSAAAIRRHVDALVAELKMKQ